ncbi:hypothetical protein POTOM_061201 [Populus tomentosa]|uniref:DUS-like FMN-binding domain-containing protein n=1 Tax=Populus tomentosa TaxID=118781 RepID=A0A8X8C0F5_POPTO|nr:hypothetical protein POTOM_061201 [Populus tomentosa]
MGVEQYRPPLFRTVARIISKHAWLYTEMLAAETICPSTRRFGMTDFWHFSPEQHPIVLQIGGNNLDNIAKATRLANSYGYDEINLKLCGCPSPKVAGHGCFGVRLMLDPQIVWYLQGKFVGEAMSVIAANTDVPVSVKCRIGLDDHDSYNELCKDPLYAFYVYLLSYSLLPMIPYDMQICFAVSLFPYFHWTSQLIGKCSIKGRSTWVVMVGRCCLQKSLNKSSIRGCCVLGTYGNSRPNIRDLIKGESAALHHLQGYEKFGFRSD